MDCTSREVTFRYLDTNYPLPEPDCALAEWYQAVRDVPISQMSTGDVARACRQRIFLEYIIPRCLDILRVDPAAGDMYDGELLLAVTNIPENLWRPSPSEQEILRSVRRSAYELTGDRELLSDQSTF